MERGYKVVAVNPYGVLRSISVWNHACVEYAEGKTSRAPSHLAARGLLLTYFPLLRDTVEFAKTFRYRQIWRVEADKTTDKLPARFSVYTVSEWDGKGGAHDDADRRILAARHADGKND